MAIDICASKEHTGVIREAVYISANTWNVPFENIVASDARKNT